MPQAVHPNRNIWKSMIARCFNTKDKNYYLYGGRGITVCERWRNSFKAFVDDVGVRPSLAHTLDRYPDKNGNYEPGNVRWATTEQQSHNKRSNHFVTAFGETKTICQWWKDPRCKVYVRTLLLNLRSGMPPELALVTRSHRWRNCRSPEYSKSRAEEAVQ
jgi:hypothetical protein